MVTGWRRVCPECGNSDGAKVERIAAHPTFRCECGYVWDGLRATFVGLCDVEGTALEEDLQALAKVIAKRMNAAVADQDHGMSQ
jgi:hypothetical protein